MHYHYHKLLIILCFNLLIFNLFYIIFAASSGNNLPPVPSCETIGIFLQFFLLASFFLMSSMSILRYLMLIKVFTNIRHFNLISVLSSYGISALIVLITIVVYPGPIKYVSKEKQMLVFKLILLFLINYNVSLFKVLAQYG